ncbi:MAG TPA: hypothetical protein VGD90_13325 [Sphingobacteriaceae bacterium]
MKNKAIIGIAAFYLMLSTGMFLCILNYGVSNLLETVCEHTDSRHEHAVEKRNCESKRGFKLIKENIKPAPKTDVPPIPQIALMKRILVSDLDPAQTSVKIKWFETKSPPSYSIPLFIKIRTILI